LEYERRVQKFKDIYKQKFWIELTDKEALEYSTMLINFIKLIIQLSNNEKIWNDYKS
jgi:hypothetical protein